MLRILSLPPGALDMLNEMQLLRLSRTVRGMYKGGKVSRLASVMRAGHDSKCQSKIIRRSGV